MRVLSVYFYRAYGAMIFKLKWRLKWWRW